MYSKNKNWPIYLGNFIAFYSFTLFSALLIIISPLFFPSQEILTSFTSGYLFLAIGFVSRPVGAVLFGHIGDCYGRKQALLASMILMACATLMIGLLPSQGSLAAFALPLLALFQVGQGLSIGGEYSGAGLLLIEKATSENRFLNGAALTTSGVFGGFVAALLAALISSAFFPLESWRVLFLLGGCLVIVAFWFSFSIVETLPPRASDNPAYAKAGSWKMLFKDYKVSLLCTISIGALMNVPLYLMTGFTNTYFAAIGAYPKTSLMFINAFIFLGFSIGLLFFGYTSKRVDPLKILFYSSLGMICFAFPFYWLIESNILPLLFLAESLLLTLSTAFNAQGCTIMAQLFPYNIRYRGMALGNSLGIAIFAGSTPYISIQLIQFTGLSWAPAIYLFIISLLGFISILIIQKNKLSSPYLNSKDYTDSFQAAKT